MWIFLKNVNLEKMRISSSHLILNYIKSSEPSSRNVSVYRFASNDEYSIILNNNTRICKRYNRCICPWNLIDLCLLPKPFYGLNTSSSMIDSMDSMIKVSNGDFRCICKSKYETLSFGFIQICAQNYFAIVSIVILILSQS